MKKRKAIFWLLFWGLLLSFFIFEKGYSAELTQEPGVKKILVVYDDIDKTSDSQERMRTLQNMLLSLGTQVTAHPIDEYQAHELEAYDGLLEVINSPDLIIQNANYLAERVTYPKLKFHIGRNLAPEWQQNLGIKLRYIVDEGVEMDSLRFQSSEQMIREVKTEAVSDSNDSQVFSYLNFENHFGKYPYAVFKNETIYAPFYIPNGVNFIVMQRLLSTWLGQPKLPVVKPILVIKDVTPVSDLQLLKKMTDKLYRGGLAFAVSATGLWNNLDEKAATNYLNALNDVAEKRGSIFLQTPYLNELPAAPSRELKANMEISLNFFLEHHVYPVGISAPSYWQHDTYLQQAALLFSDTVLLLPNSKVPIFYEKTHTTQHIKNAYAGISHDSFGGIDWRTFQKKGFLTKTALVLPMPQDESELEEVLAVVLDKPSLFNDLMYSNHRLTTTQHYLRIVNQQIYIDGQRQWVETKIKNETAEKKGTTNQSLKGFFAVQNRVLTMIVLLTLVILIVFLRSGYLLYKKKYRRR